MRGTGSFRCAKQRQNERAEGLQKITKMNLDSGELLNILIIINVNTEEPIESSLFELKPHQALNSLFPVRYL